MPKYGFRFYYPKHNAPDTIANMVKNFYHFTKLLAPDFITFSFFCLVPQDGTAHFQAVMKIWMVTQGDALTKSGGETFQ